MHKYLGLYSILLSVGLVACSGGSSVDTNPPAQTWRGVTVQVETRPSPPKIGMNEVVITANDSQRGIPAWDLIVSIRTSKQDDWIQTIEDGRVGVYRRAVNVEPGERSVLQVQVKHGNELGELRFPLKLTQ